LRHDDEENRRPWVRIPSGPLSQLWSKVVCLSQRAPEVLVDKITTIAATFSLIYWNPC
jgi:hypothetical protein